MLPAVDTSGGTTAVAVRPEALLLTLFGDYVLDRGIAVSTGGVIAVLGRLGVSEHATRATVSLAKKPQSIQLEHGIWMDADTKNDSWPASRPVP